ncbi:MAG: dTMP kinase [Candidatus Nanohaloarchaea archaeon]
MREESYPGTFIVVEGADGAGTTTQAERLAEEMDVFYTAEPAENLVGEKVDEMISSGDYSPQAVALAFAADRMVHLEEEILPRLKEGETVVCDRYYHSSLVYQTVLGAERDWVEQLNRAAIRPDLTVVLDVSAETGMDRVEKRGTDGNIFENLDFQEEVVLRYRRLEDELEEDIEVIDGSPSRDRVFSRLYSVVKEEIR